MKVLHVSETTGYSGGAAQAFFLALQLRKKGIDSFFAVSSKSELALRALEEGFEVLDISIRKNFDISASQRLSRIVTDLRPDIVHAHHPKAHNVSVISKLLFRKKFPLVVSRRVTHTLPRNFLAKFKYRTSLVDHYIAVCRYVADMLEDYGILREKISVVYSGVDRNVFNKKPLDIEFKKSIGLNEDDFVITLIGNFSKDKGQHVLIKALSLVEKEGLKFKAVFAGVGTDSEELKNIFKENISDYSKGVFLGFRRDVERILNITDISVNASIKGEALSGAVRESMACGVCCVASDIGGNREIIKDGYNGFLFKVGDFVALSKIIINLIKNPSLRNDLSINAYRSIEEKFTVEKMAENTLDVYLKVMKEYY